MMLPRGAILCGGGWLQRTIDFVRVSRRRISSLNASSAMDLNSLLVAALYDMELLKSLPEKSHGLSGSWVDGVDGEEILRLDLVVAEAMTAAVEKAVSILIKDGDVVIGLGIGIVRVGDILIVGCVRPPSVSDKFGMGCVRPPSVSAEVVSGAEYDGMLILECVEEIDSVS